MKQAIGRQLETEYKSTTEKAFALYLEGKKLAGEIAEYWYEPCAFKLCLAQRCTYTPDFMTIDRDGKLHLFEVKGFWRDDAKVKAKICAEKIPIPLTIVQRKGGQWEFEDMP